MQGETQKMADVVTELELRRAQIAQLAKAVLDDSLRTEELESTLEETQKRSSSMADQIIELQNMLVKSDQEVQRLRRLTMEDSGNIDLEHELDHARDERDLHSKQAKDLSTQLERVRLELTAREEELAMARAAQGTAQSQIEDLGNELGSLHGKLGEIESGKTEQLSADLESMQDEIANLQSRLEEELREKKAAIDKAVTTESYAAELESKLESELLAALDRLPEPETERPPMPIGMDALHDQLRETEQKLERTESRLMESELALKKARDTLESGGGSGGGGSADSTRLQATEEELKETRARLVESEMALKKANLTIETGGGRGGGEKDELKRLREELARTREQLAASRSQVRNLEDQLSTVPLRTPTQLANATGTLVKKPTTTTRRPVRRPTGTSGEINSIADSRPCPRCGEAVSFLEFACPQCGASMKGSTSFEI